MKLLLAVAVVFALAGCSTAPVFVGNKPSDLVMQKCEAVADKRESNDAAMVMVAEGAKGALVGATANAAKITFPGVGAAKIGVGSFILPFAAFGLFAGVMDEKKERERIVRECLRDEGVRAY